MFVNQERLRDRVYLDCEYVGDFEKHLPSILHRANKTEHVYYRKCISFYFCILHY